KVSGGPSWLEMDRFDVFAKIPARTTAESRRAMLQALLAERFKLTTHNDNKPMSAWALTVAKKNEFKESDGSKDPKCDFQVLNQPTAPPAPGTPIQIPTIAFSCVNMTMETFAARIPDMPAAGGYLNNRLVVDKTGIKGSFDFNIRFTPQLPATIQTTGEKI